MKSKTKTDWEARFSREKPLQIKTIEKAFAGIPAGATMLIVTPKMVDAAIRELPRGTLVDQSYIRRTLAKKHNAEYACPVTTGIALRIVSERAYSRAQSGLNQSDVTPFWRAVIRTAILQRSLRAADPTLSRNGTKKLPNKVVHPTLTRHRVNLNEVTDGLEVAEEADRYSEDPQDSSY